MRSYPNRREFLRQSLVGTLGVPLAVELRAQPNVDHETAVASSGSMMTPETLDAIDRGLAYLAATQNNDGSFGDRPQYHGHIAVTSLAGLAFLAGGHMPDRGKYGQVVVRALRFLLDRRSTQTPGFLYNPVSLPHGPMYSHGFGTLFLAEVYGMIPDLTLQQRTREALELAVQLIVNSQSRDGGWRYQPVPQQADVSVTICQIMALRAARNAGFYVPKSTVDRCIRYVYECQTPDGGFSYFRQQGSSAFGRTAAAVVALYSAGVYQGPAIDRGLRYLLAYKPGQPFARRDIPDIHYFYSQYYATQAMWTAGGHYWNEWFPAMRDELLTRSRFRGDGFWTDPTTCNHYATAMACIILQIPKNYLPILQK